MSAVNTPCKVFLTSYNQRTSFHCRKSLIDLALLHDTLKNEQKFVRYYRLAASCVAWTGGEWLFRNAN